MKNSVGISNIDQEVETNGRVVHGVTTMTTMEREKKVGGGIHAIGEKKVLIEKVKNSIILSERQGKWISISDSNLNNKSNKDFLF